MSGEDVGTFSSEIFRSLEAGWPFTLPRSIVNRQQLRGS